MMRLSRLFQLRAARRRALHNPHAEVMPVTPVTPVPSIHEPVLERVRRSDAVGAELERLGYGSPSLDDRLEAIEGLVATIRRCGFDDRFIEVRLTVLAAEALGLQQALVRSNSEVA